MASYDSDSDIEQDVTETNVLLGYASKDADEDTISRLGGTPEWLNPDSPPSAALVRCNVCKEMMVLLLELNAELPEQFPGHERRLYVFSCRKQACRRKQGSIRALRENRISKEAVEAAAAAAAAKAEKEAQAKKEAEKPKSDGPGLGNALFGSNGLGGAGGAGGNPFSSSANPFSSRSGGDGAAKPSANPFGASSNPFGAASSAASPAPKEPEPETAAKTETKEDPVSSLPKTFAETLNLNNDQTPSQPPPPPEPWPATSALPKPYPLSYLSDAEYEILDPEPLKIPQNARMEIDDSGAGDSGTGLDKDLFESSMDAAFQKFADRLAQNPDQSIRYEFRGQPLLYSKEDAVGQSLSAAAAAGAGRSGMSRCGNCGANRVFEVQMTPQAIAELESEELGLEGMDWGTVIVGVCEADCLERGRESGEVGYVEEWCGVQWEELVKD